MALNIPYSYCIIAMAVLTAIYVILGGYSATAINDFIQGIIMLVGIVLVVCCVVGEKGGLSSAFNQLGNISGDVPENTLNSLFGPDPINLFGVVILTSLGTWGLPQMIQKFYAIKDDRAIKQGTVISTLFAIVVSCGSYFMGGFGRLFVNKDDITVNGKLAFDRIVPSMLETALPEILLGIVVVLVLSASMSTLSSLVLTSSSTLTIDLIRPLTKEKMTEKQEILIMRILIAVFLIISVVIALNPNTYITTLMSISWGALAGAFLAPFMYGLFSKKITKASVWASFICGVGVTIGHMFIFTIGGVKATIGGINLASPINAGAFAMILSLIIVPVISSFTKKPDEKELEKITRNDIIKKLDDKAKEIYSEKEKSYGKELMREVERVLLLKVVDTKWMAHIDDMEELKKGINLRAYGQKNPVVEYRVEGFEMFDAMVYSIRDETVRLLLNVRLQPGQNVQREQVAKPDAPNAGSFSNAPRTVKKVGENDPCPCGSGKKYKKCCGMKE